MDTSLPDLPYTNYGDMVVSSVHSSSKATSRASPRTDLQTLTPWTSFLQDVDHAIRFAMTMHPDLLSAPFQLTTFRESSIVVNEESLRAHALYALLHPVQRVANKLGIIGRFLHSPCGNTAIGAPDFLWIMDEEPWPRPKLVVEYATWWAAHLMDLPAIHARRGGRLDTLSRQSLDALEQTYGYMTFNHNKYGILTNWQRAWFLRRADKTLEYFVVELHRSGLPISMLKAWVGMVLLANDDWFYASLSPAPPDRNFGGSGINTAEYHICPDGQYQCLALDFRLCHFDLYSIRDRYYGCVVTARLPKPPTSHQVLCKVVDVLRHPDARDLVEHEASAYATLRHLQGQVIPTLYGFYDMWGILRLLALEPVGDAIPEDEMIDQQLRKKMKAALQCIHATGHIHGDIARRNFCRKNGDVFLVDLEMCRLAEDESELDNEMTEVDML